MKFQWLFYPFTLLPNFKGKVRILKILYRILDNNIKHDAVFEVKLKRPVPYYAKLNMHCAHELMCFMANGYEADTVAFLDKLYDSKGYFLDVGANIGLISIPFTIMQQKKYTYSGNHSIYCFEAVTSNYIALKHNIALNKLANEIEVFCVGLGDVEKDVEIYVEGNLKDGEGTGTANIMAAHSDYKCERINLHINTLDNMVADGHIPIDCSLMKLDTDGYDLFILKGAETLLRTSRPIILGEFMEYCLNWHNQSVKDVIEYMDELDYRVYFKKQKEWIFFEHIDIESFVCDLLLIPKEKVSLYEWCLAP
ncbi:FkbM family methyltransferase [Desulfococcaceae bacterium HSG9]|nr:FkbM family methyltransferase [Desulfococcaceae bacterium HSG9]